MTIFTFIINQSIHIKTGIYSFVKSEKTFFFDAINFFLRGILTDNIVLVVGVQNNDLIFVYIAK